MKDELLQIRRIIDGDTTTAALMHRLTADKGETDGPVEEFFEIAKG